MADRLVDENVALPNAFQLKILLFIDIILVIVHFLFGLLFCKEFAAGLFEFLYRSSPLPSLLATVAQALAHVGVLYWIMYRLAGDFSITVKQLSERFGLYRWHPSRTAWLVMFLQVAGLLLIAFLHSTQNRWVLSFDYNYFNPDGAYDLVRIADILVFAPLREEVAFRAVLFVTVVRRLGGSKQSRMHALLISNLCFGLIHLTNLFGSRFSPAYIGLQCILGVLVGTFYSLRFMLSESLWEPLLLHMINNLCSSFLPMALQLDLADYSVTIPPTVCISLLVYNVLIVINLRELALRDLSNDFLCIDIQPTSATLDDLTTTTSLTSLENTKSAISKKISKRKTTDASKSD